MSKIKERIEEINKTAKKSRRVNNILWVVVILFVGSSIYFAITSEIQKGIAKEESRINDSLRIVADTLYYEAELAKKQLAINDSLKQIELQLLLQQSSLNLWDQTSKINTLAAYSDYFIKNPDSTVQVQKAVSELLDNKGYVQLTESNNNKLFYKVNDLKLPGEGQYYKAKSARSVRRGVIGKDGNSSRNGHVILEGQMVKLDGDIIKSGSATWAKINYAQ